MGLELNTSNSQLVYMDTAKALYQNNNKKNDTTIVAKQQIYLHLRSHCNHFHRARSGKPGYKENDRASIEFDARINIRPCPAKIYRFCDTEYS